VVVSDIGSLGEVVGAEGLKFRSGDAAALAAGALPGHWHFRVHSAISGKTV